MKKLLMMACCALFLASCGGSGNAYVDAIIELNEKTISGFEDAKTADDVYLTTGLYVEEVKRITELHQADLIELSKQAMNGDEDVKDIEKMMKESIDEVDVAKNEAIERVGIDLDELAKENEENEEEEYEEYEE